MESGVYKIENVVNGKLYVGSSKNIRIRCNQHKHKLKNNKHINKHLNDAWNKYGEINFKFSVIEYVELNKLAEREQYYVEYYDANNRNKGYNLREISESNLGWNPSEITRKNMSDSAKRKPPVSEQTKKNLSVALKGNKNGCRIVSDEERRKMSELRIGINRGEKNGMSITNRNEIIAMRNDFDNGMPISKIMIKYNRKNSFTYQIVKRLRWKWLDNSSLSD